MQIKDLKLLFNAGSLKKAQVTKAPLENGFILIIDKHIMQAQRGGNRVFKTIDAACESASKVGFKTIEVTL
ncbi:plasmid replication protein RepB [Grimontia hollisae]|uniref:plasmid replication protein RepB n=1 Tax=Grimontia hollisae TaxID=673 RepID=UPI0013034738|nr:plasmid replication protein RepB [Grimontia hollisae]